MDLYQQFIHKSRYARWRDDLGRRESWQETVDRYFDFMRGKFADKLGPEYLSKLDECRDAVLNLEVMPSMRALMTAGKAADVSNCALYNCSYLPINHPHAFDELCFVLLNGTGVGFSVEACNVNKLPEVPAEMHDTDTTIVVPDSKIGWATSLRELISMLYAGKVPKFDFSRVRPAGARLKTFGGRASGPEPLKSLFDFCISVFRGACGRKLKPIECHDICCKIGEVVVVGGVRRSALLSLSDLWDNEMRHCKSGAWWEKHGYRALANNSAVYETKPDVGSFMEEWLSLYRSGSGERGIFNRYAVRQSMNTDRREYDENVGGNPCLEVLMKPFEFCNLTSTQISPEDTLEDIKRKIRIATIMGTLQAAFTDFKYLRKAWKNVCEDERLLGVSMAGICDHDVMSNYSDPRLPAWLSQLYAEVRSINKEWAAVLGINEAAAATLVKPEGTVSQLTDRASGIHPRYSQYYIRTVRADKKDPLARMMKDAGFPCEDDVTKPDSTLVFSFPMKSPDGSKLRDDMTAIDQMNLWLAYKRHWADHTVSITVYVREHEWLEVADWVYKHFDEVTGMSFLPYDNGTYRQAPYQEISEDEYMAAVAKMPKEIDWDLLSQYESDDYTTGSQELACIGGQCELK